jgi:hypothetical protein
VRGLIPVPLHRDGDVALAVEEPIHRLLAVAARDNYRRRAEVVNRLGELSPVGVGGVGHPRERAGLMEVRRHDDREREELADQHQHRVLLEELRAGRGDHHRIDDERHLLLRQEVRDRLDDLRAEEHSRLRGIDADVVEHRVELGAGEGRRRLVHGRDGGRVLGREGDDGAHPVAAERGEGLQVGLDPRAPARVRGRDGETPGDHGGER